MKFFLLLLFIFIHTGLFGQAGKLANNDLELSINGSVMKIPYYFNFDLNSKNKNIKQAIIIIHGTNRNADSYFNTIHNIVKQKNKKADSTIIIAPHFLIEEDIKEKRLSKNYLFWTYGGWKSGSNSKNEGYKISTFSIADSILYKLKANFPELKLIVIAGHSAGGQFVNRYAACSPTFEKMGIKIRCIVANPSSYLYFNNERVQSGTTNKFEVPKTKCKTYNDYKFGLDNLYSYPQNTGKEKIIEQFGKREVICLLGNKDTDREDDNLDTSCEAMLQGKNRLERGKIYFNYLNYFYGSEKMKNKKLFVIENVGHQSSKIFNSEMGTYYLLEP